MRRYDDPELAGILGDDAELFDIARTAQARELDAPISDAFPGCLRARLMDEAQHRLKPRRLAWLRGAVGGHGLLAGVGSAAGLAMAAVALFVFLHGAGVSGVVEPVAQVPINGVTNLDPRTQAFTISFNTSMDQASVVRALHIEPATAFTTNWSGNNLTITPTHGLTASTGYIVRIDNSVARSSTGQAPKASIVVAFGTQPTPAPAVTVRPSPSPVHTLAPVALGTVREGADVVPVPGGGVLVTAVDQLPQVPAGAASSATTSSASTADSSSASASTSSSAAAAGSAGAQSSSTSASTSAGTSSIAASSTATSSPATGTATTGGAAGMVRFAGGAAPVRVGPAATAAAVAPSGRVVAAVETTPDGAAVVVENLDGSQRRSITRADPGSPVAWTGASTILFITGGHLHAVDLQGGVRPAGPAGGLAVPRGSTLVLAPGGRLAYLSAPAASTAPSTPVVAAGGGQLVDIASGTALTLPGAGTLVSFAADGTGVAWLDAGSTSPHIAVLALTGPLPGSATPTASIAVSADRLSALALGGGNRVAVTTVSAGNPEIRVIDAAGHVLASAPENATRLAFLEDGALALVTADHAATAMVPSQVSTTPAGGLAPEVQRLLTSLVTAQTGDRSKLGALPVTGGINLAALTPEGVTQGYVVSVTPGSDAGGVVTAAIRLVSVSPVGEGAPVSFADEQVTLDRSSGTYVITHLTATPLTPEPRGPHVVHVDTQRSTTSVTVALAFDSDLDPTSVAGAVAVTGPARLPLPMTLSYDAATRTVTLTAPLGGTVSSVTGPLTLQVTTGLRDVEGNPLAAAFTTSLAV